MSTNSMFSAEIKKKR